VANKRVQFFRYAEFFGCPKHRKYRAKGKPKSRCQACWIIWLIHIGEVVYVGTGFEEQSGA
jgi:hypothetical protein